ncbi:PilZ domain-containing protein [Colwellia psychrerythraea]|uniref:Type IV pilus assembly PilZ n=1 Tax=Colwellia psychrerythraea TaxID=28229 RepID=A0A099KGV9_COLPS|nr:PilZ domain-containing protein [Colwellia psychrerythraea]KGJ90024.1 type IV pilus assembly PilZ [Colwellia psychrerythraea]
MKDFDDKRDYYRMMINSEVVVTVIDDEVNSQLSATCRDLSATGMAFEIEHPLAISTHVRVRVDSASSQIQALDIRGRVVRIEEESKNFYLIGIAIEEID